MSGWNLVPIGHLVEKVRTWNPSRAPHDQRFVYIDLGAVDQETKAVVGAREILCGEAPSRARQLVAAGDILVSTVRPNLNGVAQVSAKLHGATASTGFCVLRPNVDELDGRFLFQWVKSPSFIADMVNKVTGASYPAVSDRIVYESLIPVPSLAEQRRIADILDQADTLRAKRRDTLAKLDSLTEAIFVDLFGNARTNPKGWGTKRLDAVARLINGRAFKPEEWEPEGLPIIRIQNLNDSTKPFNYTRRDYPDRFKVKCDDILFSWSGTPGTSFGCFRWRGPEGWLNQHIFKVLLDGECIDGDFFIEQINLRLGELVAKAHGGVGLQHVTKAMIDEMLLTVPPLTLQREFGRRTELIAALKKSGELSVAELEALFVSAQQRAFRGKL